MEKKDFYKWDFHGEVEREVIHEWSRNRISKLQGFGKAYNKLLIYTFDIDTLKSFIKNFNFMVIIQMAIAAVSVYLFDRFDISYDFHVSLFVSPIVFPLAFSINTDFQRREKVLEDLANFKAAAMLWFFCMREWKTAANLDDVFLNAVHNKVKNMMFNLREYLLTDTIDRRRFIGRCMYEDFSDTNQLIEQVRASKLPANTSIISRVIHLLNMLCLSFERLRVVREYRSPRSIRSFNKVLIFVLPIILAPYFISLGRKEGSSPWCQYYIAILVAGVFGALQGVQDKLDDPFDGMSEDDIKLDTIDEWTFHNLENIVHRNFTVGRFTVSSNIDQADSSVRLRSATHIEPLSIPTSPPPGARSGGTFTNLRKKLLKRNSKRKPASRRSSSFAHARNRPTDENEHNFDPHNHPYAEVLGKIKGNARVQAKKGTGTVLVTDTFTDLNKTSSSSSMTSESSSTQSDGTTRKNISPTIVTFAAAQDRIDDYLKDGDNKKRKENQTFGQKTSTKNSRFQVGKIQSPVSSITSVDSDLSSVTTSSPTCQRLLASLPQTSLGNKQEKMATIINQVPPTNRFMLSSVPKTPINIHVELETMPPALESSSTKPVIENNNIKSKPSQLSSLSIDSEKTANKDELNEIVIVNSTIDPLSEYRGNIADA